MARMPSTSPDKSPVIMHQFTATSGTIFHKTRLPLKIWFMAIALILEAKKGMSANQLKRHLGVAGKREAIHGTIAVIARTGPRQITMKCGASQAAESYVISAWPRKKQASASKTGTAQLTLNSKAAFSPEK